MRMNKLQELMFRLLIVACVVIIVLFINWAVTEELRQECNVE